MLDNMLYHKIAKDSSFSNELYPCAPIVRLVIFFNTSPYLILNDKCLSLPFYDRTDLPTNHKQRQGQLILKKKNYETYNRGAWVQLIAK